MNVAGSIAGCLFFQGRPYEKMDELIAIFFRTPPLLRDYLEIMWDIMG
jgi:hypothetical protein